jgi:hypothetical protein
MTPLSTIEPIRYVTADKVAMVVAHIPCTRYVARGYLEAARGDVDAACESWREDHMRWGLRVACERLPGSLEASE